MDVTQAEDADLPESETNVAGKGLGKMPPFGRILC
jgi:hypothetical protein